MIYGEHPGTWQQFLKRKDNIGLPIMEVKQKYLYESNLFQDFSQTQLAMLAASSAGVGAAGGRKKGDGGSGNGGDPGRGAKYKFVDGGDSAYYWHDFQWTSDSAGIGYTFQRGRNAGRLYETDTVQIRPPGYIPQTNGLVEQPVYSEDEAGTTVLKRFYFDVDIFNEVPVQYLIPTNLGYPDNTYEDFWPYNPQTSPKVRATKVYDEAQLTAQTNSPIWDPDQGFWLGNSTRTSDNRSVVVFPSRLPDPDWAAADWSKVLRPEMDIQNPIMTLTPGSPLATSDPQLDGMTFQMEPDNDSGNSTSVLWFSEPFGYAVIWQSPIWILFSYSSFSVIGTGPSQVDEVFTRDTGNVWAPEGVASFGAY